MESSAARQRGEREAPENSNSIRLRRAQELLELLSAAGVDRRPPARATRVPPIEQTVASTARNARRKFDTESDCVRLYPMPQPWIASATVGYGWIVLPRAPRPMRCWMATVSSEMDSPACLDWPQCFVSSCLELRLEFLKRFERGIIWYVMYDCRRKSLV